MRYFEAKVLVPANMPAHYGEWESALLHRYGGFHVGPAVRGQTLEWGREPMLPYYVGFTTEGADPTVTCIILAELVKSIFGDAAAYVAVTELAGPFIR